MAPFEGAAVVHERVPLGHQNHVDFTSSLLFLQQSPVSFTPMSSTSIEPGRIKASSNSFQNSLVSLFNQITMVARSSPSQSWVDYTTSIAEVLEL
jgi:hypothetical protein